MKTFKQFINEELKISKCNLTDKNVQDILTKYIDDLPIFRGIVEKGMSKVNRNTELYYDNGEFIGYFIYLTNHFNFDENKNPIEGNKSSFRTLNISDIEIRDSIRKDKTKPRYGKMIIDKILEDAKKKYDGVTLQANNDELLTKVYPRYSFVDMKYGGNGMVLWFK